MSNYDRSPRRWKAVANNGQVVYGCYYPATDLNAVDNGARTTGVPPGVEWIDDVADLPWVCDAPTVKGGWIDPVRDVVLDAINDAVADFGGDGDGLFTAAGFGLALCNRADLSGVTIDGQLVRAILAGRHDVTRQPDGAHFRFRCISE